MGVQTVLGHSQIRFRARIFAGFVAAFGMALMPAASVAEISIGTNTDYHSVQRMVVRFTDRVAQYACRGLDGSRLRECFLDLDGRMFKYRGVTIYDQLVLFVYRVFDAHVFGAQDRQVEHVGLIARISDEKAVRFVLEREETNERLDYRVSEPVLRAYLHAMIGDRVSEKSLELTVPGKGWRDYTDPRSARPGGASERPALHSHEARLGILKLNQAARTVLRR